MKSYEIRHYQDESGHDLYQDWLKGLRDQVAKVAIIRRVARVEVGNFGDHRFLQNGVSELRIDVGPGYRIYYGQVGTSVILLTHGGNKSTQAADITKAIKVLEDWRKRNETRS
jgi:putative addiction module killer protein